MPDDFVHFADTYTLAAEPQAIAAKLIEELETFQHLSRAKIACIFSQIELRLRGASCAAYVLAPTVQGTLRNHFEWHIAMFTAPLFGSELPDFLIYFDVGWWGGALNDEERERLVFHELKHIKQAEDAFGCLKFRKDTGEPVLTLVPHDTELFDEELVRYGVEVCRAEHTAIAIADGEALKRSRTRQAS